ncbi:MAG: UDP-4-amino-4,6-dideoxy-N-acetyl-beta-L-altrosamine transaminase [Candidatus Riflebacteria bacterium]|nr:UDP-4-amino-4,6-dideoxy-N-acetyl-beta-L-altrosamine transaminase [Candidatus Riflebacteria bacterium]
MTTGKFIPYGRQCIEEDDIAAVVKVLKSDYLTQGPAVESFERDFGKAIGVEYAVSCANGTAALHLACLAANLNPGEKHLTTPITFSADANCARYCGADVIFGDIDLFDLTLDPKICRKILERQRQANRPVKTIVTVDFAGHPCRMSEFSKLKKEFNLIWIHDACHSLGAEWVDENSKTWKSGEWPDIDMTVFSFHPVKHIATGEGGMVTTRSRKFANELKKLRTHGITKSVDEMIFPELAKEPNGSINPWYHEMQILGFNYRLSDLQAALGSSQLQKLSRFVRERRRIATKYVNLFKEFEGVIFQGECPNSKNSHHLVVAMIDYKKFGITRGEVMRKLIEHGIGTQVHYIPVPLMPYYRKISSNVEIPNALSYYEKALSLPCFPSLMDEDVEKISKTMKMVLLRKTTISEN